MVFPKKNSDWDYPGHGGGRRMSGAAPGRWAARSEVGAAARIDPLSGDMHGADASVLSERVVFQLWADGQVNAKSIEQARREVDNHTRLDQALTRLNLVDDKVVAEALARELGLPLADASEFPERAIAADMLPARFVGEALAMPVADDGRVLTLVMADPLDDYTLRAVALKTKRRIEINVAARRDLERAIGELYKGLRAPEPAAHTTRRGGFEPGERRAAASDRFVDTRRAKRDAPSSERASGFDRRGKALPRIDARDPEGDEGRDSAARFVRPRRVTLKDRLHETSSHYDSRALSTRGAGNVALSGARLERRRAPPPQEERALPDARSKRSRSAKLAEHLEDAPEIDPTIDFDDDDYDDEARMDRRASEARDLDPHDANVQALRAARAAFKRGHSRSEFRRNGVASSSAQNEYQDADGRRRGDSRGKLDDSDASFDEKPPARQRFMSDFVNGFVGADPGRDMANARDDDARFSSRVGGLSPEIDAPIDIDEAVATVAAARGARATQSTAEAFLPSPNTRRRDPDDDFAINPHERDDDEFDMRLDTNELDTNEIDRRALMSAQSRAQNSAARRLAMTRLRQAIRGEPVDDAADGGLDAAGFEPDDLHGGSAQDEDRKIYQAARAAEARGALVRHTLVAPAASAPASKPARPSLDDAAEAGSPFDRLQRVTPARRAARKPNRGDHGLEAGYDANTLDSLHFNAATREILDSAIEGGEGLILICGPSDAGKAATIQALTDKATSNGATTLRFDSASDMKGDRSEGPIVFVGGIRDAATAEAAARAAMMGDLVLAGMDAPSAAAAPPRLVEMGLPPYVLASSLRAVVAQQLAPRLCSACRDRPKANCPKCAGDGHDGKVAIAETLSLDDTVRALILAQAPVAAFRHAMTAAKSPSFADDAAEKVSAGLIHEGDAASAADAMIA